MDGVAGDHILLAPPFIITESQMDDLLAILEWQDEMRTNIRQVATYPAIVLLAIMVRLTLPIHLF